VNTFAIIGIRMPRITCGSIVKKKEYGTSASAIFRLTSIANEILTMNMINPVAI
jgi:hypothetical protein